ncbi:hypothetical protein EKG40_25285 [Pseudomonas moorei]|nr:hypothetical protein EKG40_25285 [Pseudomonas moorei]
MIGDVCLECPAFCRAFLFLAVCISVAAVMVAGGFALTASPFFKRRKGTKRLCPATAQCLRSAIVV